VTNLQHCPIDLRDHTVFPGLINAHDHLQLNNVPPLGHTKPFANSYEWIDAFESSRHDPAIAAAVGVPSAARHWQGGMKNLVAGVTTVAHHDPWNAVFDSPDFPVGVLSEFGWSHSLGLGTRRGSQPPRYGPELRASFSATPPEQPWIVHLGEGTDEVARAELGQLDAFGCLAANTVIVHGVGITGSGIDRVIEAGAAVVWCPSSNIGMFGRTLDARDIRRLHDAGRLALGSDSRLTGSRDLLDELRVAAANCDLSPRELLQLVTGQASRILRIPERDAVEQETHGDCLVVRGGADPHAMVLHTYRCDIRAVVRGGVPMIADPDLAAWFVNCGVDAVPAVLDGRPKLVARHLVPAGIAAPEPGFALAP
jgi:cytosine/adenosine deaminase-related metal-dependent hydrolase